MRRPPSPIFDRLLQLGGSVKSGAMESPERSGERPATGFETVSGAVGDAKNYVRWVLDAALGPAPGGRLLEIGVGHANYRGMLSSLDGFVGVDIDGDVVAAAREKWPQDQFVKIDMCDEAFAQTLGVASFDFVLSVNSLQYARDERRALENFLAVLKPGGVAAILLPALPILYGKMDQLAGHRRRYLATDLLASAEGLPFSWQSVRYFNPVGAFGWLANNFVGHASLDDDNLAGQIAFFDRFVVPISRAIDPATRRFWGQSLLWKIRK